MDKNKAADGSGSDKGSSKAGSSGTLGVAPVVYTWKEVATHNNRESCWIVIRENVYDVTKFLKYHPGGFDKLMQVAGTDATELFEQQKHSNNAKKERKAYRIGTVDKPNFPPLPNDDGASSGSCDLL